MHKQCVPGSFFSAHALVPGNEDSRCFAAGLRYQESLCWITHTYEEVTDQQPPQPLVDVTNSTEKKKTAMEETVNTI